MVTLEPMTTEEVGTWLEHSVIDFAEDLRKSRDLARGEALAKADTMLREILPQGERTSGHDFRWITDEGLRVGRIWLGPSPDDDTTLYIWDISVDDEQQGLGYGGATLDLVAVQARQRQLTGIALSVFETNASARQLYERKGYVPISSADGHVLMRLDLKDA